MRKDQGIKEMKYRLSLLQIQLLFEHGIINKTQFKQIKISLLKKYEPMIGGLELDEQRSNRNTGKEN